MKNNTAEVQFESAAQENSPELREVVDNTPASGRWQDYVPVAASGLLLLVYGFLFFGGIAEYWFSPEWTTDDAYQQLFPLIEAVYPERFNGDVIFRMMRGYLTPIHYWLSYSITLLTKSPLMTGHWVMLVQVVSTLLFTFLAVFAACRLDDRLASRKWVALAPAMFAVTWMLHTRHVMQRLTAGLPRGWSAPVLFAFLYFAISRRHKGVLVTLAVGCLLHPPSTFIAALTYGCYLLLGCLHPQSRKELLPKLRGYILLSPAYVIITYLSIKMPAEFGGMSDLETAATMPEFARPGGRFPFVPLLPYWKELHYFGFQAFLNKWHHPHYLLKFGIPILSMTVMAALWLRGLMRKKQYVPPVVLVFGLCCLLVHQLSRMFAFYLYVPNRHLQFPMAVFFIVGLSIGIWRFCTDTRNRRSAGLWGLGGLTVLMTFVLLGGGLALDGRANFNTHEYQKGKFAVWLRKYTPTDSLVAGHPTVVDPVPLIGERRVFISTEMAHPFYRGYYEKIKDRIALSLKAHYAPSLEALYDLVAPHGIDYFVFHRKLFYPESLDSASYFRPYDQLVFSLTRVPDIMKFAYRELPAELDLEEAPFMPFKDDVTAVVDIHGLGRFLGKE